MADGGDPCRSEQAPGGVPTMVVNVTLGT